MLRRRRGRGREEAAEAPRGRRGNGRGPGRAGFAMKKPEVVSRIEQGEEPWVMENAGSSISGTNTILTILERLEKRMARIEHHQILFLTHLFKHLKPAATLEKDKEPVLSVANLDRRKRTVQEDRRKRTVQEVRRVMLGRQKRVKLQKPSVCIEPVQRVMMLRKEQEINRGVMDKTYQEDKMERCTMNYGNVDKSSASHNALDLSKTDFYNKLDHSSTKRNSVGQNSLGHNTSGNVSVDHTAKSWISKTHTARTHSSTRYNSRGRSSIKYNTKVHSSIDNSFKGFISKAHSMKSHNSTGLNSTGLSSIENHGRYSSFMDHKFLDCASIDHSTKRHSSIYSTTIAHSTANHNIKSFSPVSHKIISHRSKNKNGMDSNDQNTLSGSSIEYNLGLNSMDQNSTDHNNVNQSSMSHCLVDHRNTELNNMGQRPIKQKTFKKEQEEHLVYPSLVNDDYSAGTETSLMNRSRCMPTEICQDNKTNISPLKEDTPVTKEIPQKISTPVLANIIRMPAKLRRLSQKKQSKLGVRASLAYKMNRICLPDIEMCNVSKERVRELYIGSQGSLLRFAGWIFRSLVPLQTYKQWCHVANFTGTNGKMAIPNNVKSKLMELVEENFGTTNMREKQQIRDGVNNQLRNPRKTDFHPGL
uniref:Uncharacterized protein LOC117354440 isoform X2 n=1 Tax=Geotrypetes seraphini TaxID=260995 RepID=A0A6P8QK44_GEOSA|nr:uncharacterized protein LOC117354440 isoform X2 [Geotrypetes seraphini]